MTPLVNVVHHFENRIADGRKPSGPGRPGYTGGLAPYRYGNLRHALGEWLQSVNISWCWNGLNIRPTVPH